MLYVNGICCDLVAKGENMDNKEKKLIGNYSTHIIGLTSLLLIIVIICLVHFYRFNQKRLSSQAEAFLTESTIQKSDFLSEAMKERICQIENYAFLYSLDFIEDRIHSERLKELEKGSLFDAVRFIDRNGIDYTSDGEMVDISERDYFKKAMNGESGYVYLISKITGERLLGYYAPVHSNNEIVGVMVGFQETESVSEMLSASLYGQTVSVLLINAAGDIIGNSVPEVYNGLLNVSELTNDSTFQSSEDRMEAEASVTQRKNMLIHFMNSSGNEAVVCIQPVEGTDWFLVESMPETMIRDILSDYTDSATILFVIIIIMFLVYILIAVLSAIGNMKRDKVLENELGKNEQLTYLSVTDELTGLFNRHAYEQDVMSNSERFDEDFVYLSVDLNGLKVVNDNLGHAAGDALIRGAAECLREATKNYGTCYRIGGDEFVAMISVSEERLTGIIADLEAREAQWVGENGERLSLSIGFSEQREFSYMDVVQLAKVADQRMYADKSNYYKRKGFDRRGRNSNQ